MAQQRTIRTKLYQLSCTVLTLLLLMNHPASCTLNAQTKKSKTSPKVKAKFSKASSIKKLKMLKAKLSFNKQGELVEIDISERDIFDKDLPNLSVFANLREFHAIYTKLNGNFLSTLKNCESLEVLDLYAAPINDKGLLNIKRHPKLKDVNLMGSKISDKSIKTITSWRNLKRLEITSPHLTDKGIRKLYEELSEVEIFPQMKRDFSQVED